MADTYNVRLQLVDVKLDHSAYTTLHEKMLAAKFFREFIGADKTIAHQLPHAEYMYWEDQTSAKAVLAKAKGIADNVHKPGCRIIVTLQGGLAHENLETRTV